MEFFWEYLVVLIWFALQGRSSRQWPSGSYKSNFLHKDNNTFVSVELKTQFFEKFVTFVPKVELE